MSIHMENNPQYHSSLTDKYYNSWKEACEAEMQLEAMALAPTTNLHKIVKTHNVCFYNNDQAGLGPIELWLRRLITIHNVFAAGTCSYSTIKTNDCFQEVSSLDYTLRILIRMDRIGDRGELIGEIDRFLQKFYPEMYVAYFSNGGILNVNSGAIAVFGRTVPASYGDTQYFRYSAPILHVEKLFEYHLTRFQAVLKDTDFLP